MPTPDDDAFVGELIDLALALGAELQALAPTNAPASPALMQVLERVVPAAEPEGFVLVAPGLTLEARTQAERRAAAHYRNLVTGHTPQ